MRHRLISVTLLLTLGLWAARAGAQGAAAWVLTPPGSDTAAAFGDLQKQGKARLSVTPPPDMVAGGAIYLDAPGQDIDALIQALPSGSLLVVNDCGWSEELPALRDGKSVQADIALPDNPEGCDAGTLRAGAVRALGQGARAAQISQLAEAGYRLHAAKPAPAPGAGELIITALPKDQVIRLRQDSAAVIPASAPSPLNIIAGGGDRGVLPRRAGLPEPSIIVGELASLLAPGLRGPMGIAFEDREKIRARDPELFGRLLVGGGFDPDPAQLPAAIQSELARMKCYGGAIDGLWGGGSEAALSRYVKAAKAAGNPAGATIETYRVLVDNSQAECPPVPVAATRAPAARGAAASANRSSGNAAAPKRSTTAAAPQRATTSRRPAATQQPAAPAAPATRSINPGLMGSGVFR